MRLLRLKPMFSLIIIFGAIFICLMFVNHFRFQFLNKKDAKIRYIQVRLNKEDEENDENNADENADGVKYVQYVCDDPHRICGGYADRLKGIMSSYALSIVLKRKFLINITQPCNIEQVLRPNRIDWLKLKSNNKNKNFPLRTVSVADFGLYEDFHLLNRLKSIDVWKYFSDQQFLDAKVINVKTNLMLNNALAENPFLSHTHLPAKSREAFKTHNLIYILYRDLFKLAPKLEEKYQALLQKAKPNADTFLICAQVRVGGTSQNNVKDDFSFSEENDSMKFWAYIKQRFIHDNRSSLTNDKNYRLFITSDLDSVKKQAQEVFDKEFVVLNDDKPSHLDKDFENMGDNCEKIESTIVDFHMLQNCDASVVSHSGFGILGSLNRPVPYRNLHVFTKANQTELMINYIKRNNLLFKQIFDIEKDIYFT